MIVNKNVSTKYFHKDGFFSKPCDKTSKTATPCLYFGYSQTESILLYLREMLTFTTQPRGKAIRTTIVNLHRQQSLARFLFDLNVYNLEMLDKCQNVLSKELEYIYFLLLTKLARLLLQRQFEIFWKQYYWVTLILKTVYNLSLLGQIIF